MILDGEEFRKRLRGYERSAWRFECQPVYNFPVELEHVARFLAGEPKPDAYGTGWHANVRSLVEAGKSIGRVRTVRDPLTDYQRCQLAWVIPDNINAGEDIRILDLTEDGLGLPAQDFWLFDNTTVVHLNFRADGTLINVEQLEDPDLDQYLTWRDTALKHAVTYSEYAARA